MIVALLVAALGAGPHFDSLIVEDRVCLVEINHYYDETGRLVLDQVIFYQWNGPKSRFDVIAWRLINDRIPTFRPEGGRYVAVWLDGLTLRRVKAISKRETWTQYDPEQRQRRVLPSCKRRELSYLPTRLSQNPEGAD